MSRNSARPCAAEAPASGGCQPASARRKPPARAAFRAPSAWRGSERAARPAFPQGRTCAHGARGNRPALRRSRCRARTDCPRRRRPRPRSARCPSGASRPPAARAVPPGAPRAGYMPIQAPAPPRAFRPRRGWHGREAQLSYPRQEYRRRRLRPGPKARRRPPEGRALRRRRQSCRIRQAQAAARRA